MRKALPTSCGGPNPLLLLKLSIVERPSHYEIGNSVTCNVTDDRDALPKVGSAIFDLRIQQR